MNDNVAPSPTRRIALFSDIHGNLAALDAVLADIRGAGIDESYCLGDLVGYGPDSPGVVARIRSLAVETIQGNYDEGVGTRSGGCGCYYATDEARRTGEASYAFTDAALDDADHEWLAALPGAIRLEHEGVRILLVHGSPRKNNEYLLPDRTDEQLVRLADKAGADIVCVGHVHIPYHRTMQAADGRVVHYVSAGSVGKPKDGDARACWVELVLDAAPDSAAGQGGAVRAGATGVSCGAIVHRVGYDVEGVARAIAAAGLPPALADALRTA